MQKALSRIFALMTVVPAVFAADNLPCPQIKLDKINFQVSARQWVSTQTALLNVTVNATLANGDLVKARAELMDRLNKIAKADWHLLQFDRSQDSSGLEKLYVHAQARVNQEALTAIYQNAKSVSAPGAQYDIANVEFKPSLEEVQAGYSKVREQLYQLVNDELARMNKAYPSQNYTVSRIVFSAGDNPPVQARANKGLNMVMMANAAAPAVAVSNELVLNAFVQAAANRKP